MSEIEDRGAAQVPPPIAPDTQSPAASRKLSLWERIFGPSCDHDWFDKATMEKRRVKDGTIVAHTFIKECRKCHRIWAQKVGIYD